MHLKTKLQITGHTWLAARCGGPDYVAVEHHDGWRRGIMAHTSPVYIATGGQYDAICERAAQQGVNFRLVDAERLGVSLDETVSIEDIETFQSAVCFKCRKAKPRFSSADAVLQSGMLAARWVPR